MIRAPRPSNSDARSTIDCSPAILQNEKTEKIHLDAALTIPKPQLLIKICSIANLFDKNIRKFDAKNHIFFPECLDCVNH